jgi:quercetin dioxygenase-like cupin family protein
MKIISQNKTSQIKVDMEGAKNAFKQVPISKEDGSPLFSFRVFTIEPGGYTPKHSHPYEHINYVIKGKGTLFSKEKGEQTIQTGDFALVLPNEVHQYKNVSKTKSFVMICAVQKEFE